MRRSRFLQVIASCVTPPPVVMPMTGLEQTQVKPGFNHFSPQQDIEIGKQSALEAEKQLQLIRDGRALEYLDRLGQRLAEQAPGERYPYTFKLINAAEINAFSRTRSTTCKDSDGGFRADRKDRSGARSRESESPRRT